MKTFNEEFLHYIWKNRLFQTEYLIYGNERLEVIDPGLHNHSSGPDFFNARIKIGNTLWAGNVEVHIRASDWLRHGHQKDPAYDSVILHAVFDNDLAVFRKNGDEIPAVRLSFHPSLLDKYSLLLKREGDRRECRNHIPFFESVFIRDWLGKLMIERLEEKTGNLLPVLKESHYDWDHTLYISLAMAFGMKLNAEPFRLLAESVPLKFVLQNRDAPKTVNAAFFGQAGFLDEIISDDPYYEMLQKEYKSIESLLPPPLPGKHIWKFMRARPAGFPTVRIPQLISVLVNIFPVFERLTEAGEAGEIRKILASGFKNYFVSHFLYGKPGRRKKSHPGKETLDLLLINAVVPLVFLYGKFRMKNDVRDMALNLLEDLSPENNEIIKKWNNFGLEANNAFDSQAVIQLETRYCLQGRCIDCSFGNRILTGKT